MCKNSQPICGNGGFVGDIEWLDVQWWETRDLTEKVVEVTVEAREVKGGKIGEPFEEGTDERACWIEDSQW